jgi:hypothetical protein
MNFRVALVLSSNIEIAPYYLYYTDCLEKINVAYDIISWDRLSLGTEMKYCFKYPSPQSRSFIRKIYDFSKYSEYIQEVLLSSRYDYIIVFTIANSIFLGSFLKRNFRNKYIIDIRDYSPIFPFTKKKLARIFKDARMIYISSIGFLKWLPQNFNYVISHNVRLEALESKYQVNQIQNKNPLIISAFGSIRNYESNRKLIENLRLSNRYIIEFNGLGFEPLKKIADQNCINVRFGGRYNKEEEKAIIERADIINILFPRTTVDYANLNNRFYHAIIHRKPVIVNDGSILAEYVGKYYLGLVLQSDKDILKGIERWVNKFDINAFESGCRKMTDILIQDVKYFRNSLQEIFVPD